MTNGAEEKNVGLGREKKGGSDKRIVIARGEERPWGVGIWLEMGRDAL